MNIIVVCPAPAGSRRGNRVSALRWARLLGALNHRVVVTQEYHNESCDALIALHARKSYAAIQAYRERRPKGPLIVCLTGTDLYRDLDRSPMARQALAWADRIVVLQPKALEALPADWQEKTRVIWQSVAAVKVANQGQRRYFGFCVLGHLRWEKDPLRAARALRRLPAEMAVRVYHAGAALSPSWARQARVAMRADSRYRWLGEIPRWRARRLLAGADAMIISSRMEGGANVVSEAIVQGVPVLASHIPGNLGMLGDDYPAYFPVGDDRALAELMRRVVEDRDFRERIGKWCRALAPRFDPAKEKAAWEVMVNELMPRIRH